jgi:uncharacterized protein YukE
MAKEKTAKALRVSKIQIRNVLGIQALEFKPGAVTVVSGANETNKTSVLEAVRSAIGGGHDATLVHKGAEEGEVVIVLDDGEIIRKTIGSGGSELAVEHPDFGSIKRAQTYLDKLTDGFCLNPIEFLTNKKNRVDLLLEALPMKLEPAQVAHISPLLRQELNPEAHAFVALDLMRTDIFEQRTGINRAAKEKRSTLEEVRRTLPEAPEGSEGFAGELQRLGAERLKVERELQEAAERWSAEHQARLDELNAEMNAELDKVKESYRGRREEVMQSRQKGLDDNRNHRADLIGELDRQTEQVRARNDVYARAAQGREYCEQLENGAARLEADAQVMTDALAQIDAVKAGLLEKLPIPGLEVRGSQLFLDGITFDRVNEARKVDAAIQVAKLRAGGLGLVVVDGLECLDDKTFAAFVKAAAASDLQFIVTRVTSGPLKVETFTERATAETPGE